MIKVASYCRVSTDHMDQVNSFEAQQRYFREYISRQPQWELYAIYADEGVSGTSTRKRTQFKKMINDAYMQKFSIIITKEVSRFSRNILDAIAYTRELKALGVNVIFMNDGFSSFDPDYELRLSIMGSIAQEESRKTSTRVKWGQTRQMEQGVVFGPSLLGYDVKNGMLSVNPEGAEIVRLIFHKYGIEKKGAATIAKELRQNGIQTSRKSPNWSSSQIIKILRNEKYVGDLVQKKSITTDYLSHRKKCNRGEEEMIIIPDHHEPIVDRTLWETVQNDLIQRNKHNNRASAHSNRYIFSGKIICGECGARFVSRRKMRNNGTPYMRWICYTATSLGVNSTDSYGNQIGCSIGRTISDNLMTDILTEAIHRLPLDFDWIVQNLSKIIISAISDTGAVTDDMHKIDRQVKLIEKKKTAVIDAYASGLITANELGYAKDQYDKSIMILRKQHREGELSLTYEQPLALDEIVNQIQSIVMCKQVADSYYRAFIKKVIVRKNGTMEIHFNGIPQIFHYQLYNQKM